MIITLKVLAVHAHNTYTSIVKNMESFALTMTHNIWLDILSQSPSLLVCKHMKIKKICEQTDSLAIFN